MFEAATVTTTSDQKATLRQLIRNLPAILAGRHPDVGGIAHGFKTRIGFAILNLIVPNFDDLGRGLSGADGDKWKPLSPQYLAYGRRFGRGEQAQLKKQAGLGREHRYAPGGDKGLLTKDQLKLWRAVYARKLAQYAMKEDTEDAKSHAAAVAWMVVKSKGGKTKLEVFGNRQVQILVDTGRGRASLTPGTITETGGPNAEYQKPAPVVKTVQTEGGKLEVTLNGEGDQVFDTSKPDCVVVGTNVGYMGAHHRGGTHPKNKLSRRRLWPENFPSPWWDNILGTAISGLVRITELCKGGRPL